MTNPARQRTVSSAGYTDYDYDRFYSSHDFDYVERVEALHYLQEERHREEDPHQNQVLDQQHRDAAAQLGDLQQVEVDERVATVRFPVVYFVDPKFVTDPDTKDYQDVTLSYTFYPVAKAG